MTFWTMKGLDYSGKNEWFTEEGRLRLIGKGNETFLGMQNATSGP